MPPLSPWFYVGLLASWLVLGGGAYWYGNHVGHAEAKADQADAIAETLKNFAGQVRDVTAKASQDAAADFKARTAQLDRMAAQMRTARGVMDNAASNLAASLAGGACVLSPAQRLQLECIRRPGDARCTAPAAP